MTSVVMLGLKSGFNTQPPKGGCHRMWYITQMPTGFQHTAARRRLLKRYKPKVYVIEFQHTAARRRLRIEYGHSYGASQCFNTQPRGGCYKAMSLQLIR